MKACLAILMVGFLCTDLLAAEKFSVKVVATEPPAEVAEPIRKLLPKQSDVVLDANGNSIAEFWFRSELPGKGTAEQIKNGLTYREVIETSILGVVKFPSTFIDYRKQEIAAGVYTLRIAFQPETGDHNDTAPHSEFVLLCPADKDTKADEMEPKSLYKMSFASTGGEHPGVMLLYPNADKAKEPKLVDRGKDVWTLNGNRPVVSDAGKVELGFAITVAGFSKLR